eukprot:CAMPEP_0202906344 /NCGR_PEP_ID=MMETSP1392-20130828/38461_1 /ASSEMBLY_ACC=CAM_ASM_000868 /TAXON_ID=225041 /ORGANISM="Chlamydomonas chlamydogama, Strain SAG 11-48b" /LENGTH=226 /DNA_ID=CAMNT_0049594811 /DNA_START=338 /DNA_END=1018 /DNA_ORIENTATION=+
MKKEARELLFVVRGLTSMTDRQLKALSHLLEVDILEAVQVAARLARNNQGRKRQEALIAALLRTRVSEGVLDKLEEAVRVAESSSNPYEDADVSGRMDVWREGLLENDQEIMEEVLRRGQAAGIEAQQLRQLVRQYQQATRELEQALQAAGSSSGESAATAEAGASSSSGSSDEDAEVAALLAARASPKIEPDVSKQRSALRSAARALNKVLKKLAETMVSEATSA